MENELLKPSIKFRACVLPDLYPIDEFDRLINADLQSKHEDGNFVFTFNNVSDGNDPDKSTRLNTISIHRGTPVKIKVGTDTVTVFRDSTLFIKDEDGSEEILRIGTIIPYAIGSFDERSIAFIDRDLFDSKLKRKIISYKRFLLDIIRHNMFSLNIRVSINTVYVFGNFYDDGIDHYYSNVSDDLSTYEYLTTEDKSSQLFKLSSKKK